jgi:hypothetical protein
VPQLEAVDSLDDLDLAEAAIAIATAAVRQRRVVRGDISQSLPTEGRCRWRRP